MADFEEGNYKVDLSSSSDEEGVHLPEDIEAGRDEASSSIAEASIGETWLTVKQESRDEHLEPDGTSSSSNSGLQSTRTRLEKILKDRLPDFIDTRQYANDPIDYLVPYVACLLLKDDQSQVQKELSEIKFRDDIDSDKLKEWVDECRSIAINPKGLAVAAKKMPRRKTSVAAATLHLVISGSQAGGASSPQASASSVSVSSHQDQMHCLERPAPSAATSLDVPLLHADVAPRRHRRHRSRSPRTKRSHRSSDPIEILSRELVRILRHRAERCNVRVTDEGFAPIHQVLSAVHVPQSCSIDDVRQVVRVSLHSDSAPRFEIREGEFPGPWIRATRYHSLHGVSMQPSVNERRLSEALCKILRHEAHESKVTICPDGFASLNDVMAALRRIKPTRDDVLTLVRTSTHSDGSFRFQVEERRSNGIWIRATRGHTMSGIRL